MKVFFVSGVDTGIGKTYITHKLTQYFQELGYICLAIKPIETGVQNEPQDSLIHLAQAQTLFPHLTLQEINLYSFPLPSSPCVADEEKIIKLDEIYRHIKRFENSVEILLIEGAGGLFAPISHTTFMLSLAQELQYRFNAKTLIVCDGELGMIHRFLSAKFIVDSLKLKHLFFLNVKDWQTFKTINLPFMQDYCFQTQVNALAKEMLL